ncbi:cytochrome c oxidase assembly protein [Halopseudomonas sp.]|uniref:cytochrome c oxidase assembly protein n=1 Tax=Halopseudomonas sp. TaxID=2901191 RepID=UPI00356278EA
MSHVQRTCLPSLCVLWGASMPAMAHSPTSGSAQEQIASMLAVGLLGVFWLFYLAGSRRRQAQVWRAMAFHAAMLLGFFAVAGPLDEWAETSTTAHMVQHMLFMVVIAPLWVLSRPLKRLAAAGGKWVSRGWRPLLRLTRHPVLLAYLHGLTIWFWHMPRFYQLALDNSWWHVVEHGMFMLTAGLFWWAVLYGRQRSVHWSLFALLLTLMHTGFLGALLTFAQAPLYGEARSLQDQQLAGLIMWVPGALPYLLAAAWVGYRRFRTVHRGALDSETAAGSLQRAAKDPILWESEERQGKL